MKERGKGRPERALRWGVIGLSVTQPESVAAVNNLLSQFAEHLRGRLGVPCRSEVPARNFIAILFEGSTDTLGALSGKLGKITGVEVKSLLFKEGTSQWVEQ